MCQKWRFERKYLRMKKLFSIVIIMLGMVSCQHDTIIVDNGVLNQVDIVKLDSQFLSKSYYWSGGEKICVTPNYNKYYVVLSEVSKTKYLSYNRDVVGLFGSEEYKSRHTNMQYVVYNVLNDDLNEISNIRYKAPYYRFDDGTEFAITDIFSVKLLFREDIDFMYELANKMRVSVIGVNKYDPLWFYIQCDNNSAQNALEMANYFYETKKFKFAVPEMMIPISPKTTPNDPLFSTQWALYNNQNNNYDINYLDIQDYDMSNLPNITIAIVDSGVDLEHPDLDVNIKESYDAHTKSQGQLLRGPHGTMCSGVMVANTNNNIGITGIADGVGFMPISVQFACYASNPDDYSSTAIFAEAIQYAHYNGADVINNSWFSDYSNDDRNEAISAAIKYGRNGLGCVVVFCSGNDSQSTCAYPSKDVSEILTVGAISKNGMRSTFSNYGDCLDIVAPGGSIKTTINGLEYEYASGTSLAAPHVSAVAALILSVNPYLTQKEVSDIIEKTATKLPAYQYSNVTGRPNGTWNNETGYGLLNAKAAVDMAMSNEYDKIVTEINNVTITSPRVYGGDIIKCEQVMVYPTGVLILSADDVIEIQPDFRVEAGGAFEFYSY